MQNALNELSNFVAKNSKGEVYPWGNGAAFDISMLEHCYRQYGIDAPWEFWDVRDCRTIEHISTLDKRSFKRDGVHHGALDDALHQVKYISVMIKEVRGVSL